MAVSRICHSDHGARSAERADETEDGGEHWTRRAAVVALAGLLGAGCLGTPPERTDDGSAASVETTFDTTETPTPTDTTETSAVDSPELADVLVGLVRADDRAAYATENRLDYRDGRVRVVVELVSGGELPPDVAVDVVARGTDVVEAYVDPDDLPRLADSEAVTAVRPPRRSLPQSS